MADQDGTLELPQNRQQLLAMALAFSAVLVLIAITGTFFDIRFWESIDFNLGAAGLGFVIALGLTAIVASMVEIPWRIFRPIRRDLAKVCTLFERSTVLDLFLISLGAGISEEALFRGVLQPLLARLTGPLLAVLLVGLLFGLVHFLSTTYFLFVSALGVGFGYVFLTTGNLLILIVAHFLYDFLALVYGVKLRRLKPG